MCPKFPVHHVSTPEVRMRLSNLLIVAGDDLTDQSHRPD